MMEPLEHLLAGMVAIPSMNPMGRGREGDQYCEEQLAGYVADYLRQSSIDVQLTEVAPHRPNVMGRLDVGAPQTVLLEAHLDTVFADRMAIEPFNPVVRDGKLYGRGSCDTKGSLAAFLHVLRSFAVSGRKPGFNIILLATVDEEYGFTGASDAISRGIRADWGIIGEPTGLHVIHAHKGVIRWRVVTHGRSSHSAYPDRGVNAIYAMGHVLARLEALSAEMLGGTAHPLLGTPTLSVGVIEGGQTVNIVPDRCSIEVDRRTLPGETEESVLSAVRHVLAGIDNWTMEGPHLSIGGMEVPVDAPAVTRLASAIRDVAGDAVIETAQYATDAGVLGAAFPCVVFGPGDIARAHTDREYIELDQLHNAAAILERLLAA